jgi:hypothetical protein
MTSCADGHEIEFHSDKMISSLLSILSMTQNVVTVLGVIIKLIILEEYILYIFDVC